VRFNETNNVFGWNGMVQAVAAELLVHVIFGFHKLEMDELMHEDVCRSFVAVERCPGSPCNHTLFEKVNTSSSSSSNSTT
jgi:hypothetical protein